jgi:hypothetical protein
VLRKNSICAVIVRLFNGWLPVLEILVGQKPALVVGFEPMVEMHVIEVRRHRFLSQFVCLRVEKRNVASSQQRHQRLENAIGVGSTPEGMRTSPGSVQP